MNPLSVIRVHNGLGLADFSGDYSYRLVDGRTFFFFGLHVAWCAACETFVIVEEIPSVEWIQTEIDEFEKTRPSWPEIDARERQCYVNWGFPSSDVPTQESRFEVLKAKLEWRKARKSPQKCLSCGSVFGIRLLPTEEEIEHPHGGGSIKVTHGPVDLYTGPPPPIHFYDAEGNYLATESPWLT